MRPCLPQLAQQEQIRIAQPPLDARMAGSEAALQLSPDGPSRGPRPRRTLETQPYPILICMSRPRKPRCALLRAAACWRRGNRRRRGAGGGGRRWPGRRGERAVDIPKRPPSPILSRMSRRRIAAPRLAARRCGRPPPRAGAVAEAGGGAAGGKGRLNVLYSASRGRTAELSRLLIAVRCSDSSAATAAVLAPRREKQRQARPRVARLGKTLGYWQRCGKIACGVLIR
jgi:hypothetical protein